MKIDDYLDLAQIATPGTVDSGRTAVYPKSDGRLYTKTGTVETIMQGTRMGTTTTWAFADSTNVDATMADGLAPRVGDTLVSTNGFSYGAVHAITAVYGTGPWTVDINGTILYNVNGSDSGWQAPTLAAGWGWYGGSFHTIQYRKINDLLYLKGLVKRTGASAPGLTPIYTLPSGTRPIGAGSIAAWGSPTGSGETGMALYADTSGAVSCSSHTISTNGYFYMNVVFPAVG